MAAESQRKKAHRIGSEGRELPQTLRDASEDDPGIVDAYDAGHAGRSWQHYANGDAPAPAVARDNTSNSPTPVRPELYSAPPAPPPTPAPAPPTTSSSPWRSSSRGNAADTGAGLLLGAFMYALLLSLVNYGTSGPLDWLKAKFLNKPTAAPGTAGATTGSAAPGAAKAALT